MYEIHEDVQNSIMRALTFIYNITLRYINLSIYMYIVPTFLYVIQVIRVLMYFISLVFHIGMRCLKDQFQDFMQHSKRLIRGTHKKHYRIWLLAISSHVISFTQFHASLMYIVKRLNF